MTKAKKQGYSDVLYLDPIHKRHIEEVSASNIFVVKVVSFFASLEYLSGLPFQIDIGFWFFFFFPPAG